MGMPVWGRGGGGVWPCPFLKYVKMKKKEKETKNANSIDAMFDRNFHFVSRTEGEICARFILRRLCLVGGVPVGVSKEAFRQRQINPSEQIKPRRPVLPNGFDIDFTWGLPLSFPMFLEAHVRRAIVTSSSRRAGVFNEGRAASLKKKKDHGLAIASRREAVTRFVSDLLVQVEDEPVRQFETQSLTWQRTTRGTASKNDTRVINDVVPMGTRGERDKEREREWERRAAVERKTKGLPCQVPTTNVSKWFKFRVNVDQVRIHGLYYWYVCARIFIEGSLACLATDIDEILYLYRTFFSDARTKCQWHSDSCPNLPAFCGGGGVLAKYGHACIWQMGKFTDRP